MSSELQPEPGGAAMPAVEIERTPSRAPSYAAIVSLRGEHDMDSDGEIRRALDSIEGDVLIDLSACGFLESSVIGTLLRAFQDRASTGYRLELVVPPANRIITRTIEIVSLRELLTVHDVLPGSDSPRTVQAHPS